MRRRRPRAGGRPQRRRGRPGRRPDRRRHQGAGRRRAALRPSTGRERRGRWCWPGAGLQPPRCSRPPPPARTSRRASPPCSMWRRSPTSSRSRAPTPSMRPIYAGNAIATVQTSDTDQGHDRARHRLRRRPRPAAAPRPSKAVAGAADAACPASSGSEITKSDRPELTAAKIIVSRRPGTGQRREVPRSAGAAGRQARCGGRRQPRCRRRRLRAQRLPGRPDRQDRRAAAVRRRRHLAARSSTWPA